MGDSRIIEGHKVFVGSLPPDCTSDELRIVFSHYGEVNNIRMMPPQARTGQRCAFVFYEKAESAEDAIEVLDGVYKIREDAEAPIDVRWPKESREKGGSMDGKGGGKGKDDRSYSSYSHHDQEGRPPREGSKRLFVGSLPLDITEEDLRHVFSTYGEVKDVHIMSPTSAGRRGAFVCYATSEAAEDAIKVLDRKYKIREGAEEAIQVRWADEGGRSGKKGFVKGGGKGWNDNWQDRDDWQGRQWQDGRGGNYGGKGGWANGGSRDNGWNDDPHGWSDGDWGGSCKGGKGGKGSDGKGSWGGGGKGHWGDGWDSNDQWNQQKGGAKGSSNSTLPQSSESTRLYVANLPEDIQEQALEYVFSTYGKVEKVHIMSERSVRGCVAAFVDLSSAEDAETAISALHKRYEIREGFGNIIVSPALNQRNNTY